MLKSTFGQSYFESGPKLHSQWTTTGTTCIFGHVILQIFNYLDQKSFPSYYPQNLLLATTGLISNQNLYIDGHQEETINLSGIVNQHVKLEKYSFNIEPVPASFAAQLDFQPKKIISITIPTQNDMSYYRKQVFIIRHNL